jgi:hypothetical protein
MYNSKNPHTWDESLPYVENIYKKSIHTSTDHIPFQVGLVFQELGPMDVALPLATTQEDSSHAPTGDEKDTRIIERIQHIFQQVQYILHNSNAKHKNRHYLHWVPHQF